jgi:hypothetical protein
VSCQLALAVLLLLLTEVVVGSIDPSTASTPKTLEETAKLPQPYLAGFLKKVSRWCVLSFSGAIAAGESQCSPNRTTHVHPYF